MISTSGSGGRWNRPGWSGARRRSSGVTMVELMFAIAVLAVTLAFAVPSYRDASLNSKLNAVAGSLHASVLVARSEAIKANRPTTLCASSDGATCTGSWTEGWIILDADDELIDVRPAPPLGYKVTQAGGIVDLTFQPIGVGSSAATFTVCRNSPLGSQERVVSVTATGVAHVTRTETGSCP
jgi:type IV fimbrial biogenesis protein FimT